MDGLSSQVEVLTQDMAEVKGDISVLKGDVAELKSDVGELKDDMTEVKSDIVDLKKTTMRTDLRIENEILPKIEVLFDGHVQNAAILARIEQEISRPQEVIFRKAK